MGVVDSRRGSQPARSRDRGEVARWCDGPCGVSFRSALQRGSIRLLNNSRAAKDFDLIAVTISGAAVADFPSSSLAGFISVASESKGRNNLQLTDTLISALVAKVSRNGRNTHRAMIAGAEDQPGGAEDNDAALGHQDHAGLRWQNPSRVQSHGEC